jgi:hypothetical protein
MKSYLLKKGILNMLVIMFSVLTVSTPSSCKKEDKNGDKGTNDNYYVKYVINGNGTYGHFSNWTATTPQGTYANNGYQTRSWNQTFGPINKGFKCEVQIGDYIGGAPSIEIHVSKNQEPFALKVTETGSSASYTVDF